jgi:uncharacterized protein YjbI with pentapeptide repeats
MPSVPALRIEIERALECRFPAALTPVPRTISETATTGRASQLRSLNDDGVSLAGVNLQNAHLRDLRLMGADLVDADFGGFTLINGDFGYGRTKLFSSRRYLCTDLTGANFSDADFSGGAAFDGLLLRLAKFGSQVGRTQLFSNLSFRNAILWGTTFEDLIFAHSDFSGARITMSVLKKVQFKMGTLGQAGNRFTKAQFVDVDLSDTDLDARDLEDQGAYYCRVMFRDGSKISNSCDHIDAVAPSHH